jgi:hypothetical protein
VIHHSNVELVHEHTFGPYSVNEVSAVTKKYFLMKDKLISIHMHFTISFVPFLMFLAFALSHWRIAPSSTPRVNHGSVLQSYTLQISS